MIITILGIIFLISVMTLLGCHIVMTLRPIEQSDDDIFMIACTSSSLMILSYLGIVILIIIG